MTGRELSEKLNYTGMERGIRKLALDQKLATADEIAMMSELDVCNLIAKEYEIVYAESEHVGLVPKDRLSEYDSLVTVISR